MRERPLTVGLTGVIGSGKSAALAAFGRAGAGTVSCDAIAHRLSRKGGPLHRAVARAFGPAFLDARGELDRPALARRVFARPAERRRLERLSHPLILREMRREMARCRRPVIVVDVPLLFETGMAGEFEITAVVSAPLEAARKRTMDRDGASRGDVDRRLRAQWPLRRKVALADVVLRNDRGLNDLRQTVTEHQRAFELIARSPQ